MVSRLRVVDTVRKQTGSTIKTAAEFVVEAGKPGVSVASQDIIPPNQKFVEGGPEAPDNDKPLY